MVKNTKGGKGHKSLGRKFQNQPQGGLRESSDPLELYGFVNKMLGNGMCEVTCINENNEYMTLIGHIRNKFRGRHKRNNLVTQYSIVLIGLRDFETIKKNCDLITIYDDNQLKQLKCDPNNKVIFESLQKLNPTERLSSSINNDGFEFGIENDNEDVIDMSDNSFEKFVTDDNEIIDIDDI